uniref:Ovule protein n=1 Tax=Romanomermis culicivorax TaxID=13658 RepID=A0A915J3T5_ROMCU
MRKKLTKMKLVNRPPFLIQYPPFVLYLTSRMSQFFLQLRKVAILLIKLKPWETHAILCISKLRTSKIPSLLISKTVLSNW